MNEEEGAGPVQAETDLEGMHSEHLRAELDEALAELADLEELRGGFLGQTGVHIGMRALESTRRRSEREEANLKERISILRKLLGEDHVRADRKG